MDRRTAILNEISDLLDPDFSLSGLEIHRMRELVAELKGLD